MKKIKQLFCKHAYRFEGEIVKKDKVKYKHSCVYCNKQKISNSLNV